MEDGGSAKNSRKVGLKAVLDGNGNNLGKWEVGEKKWENSEICVSGQK